MNKKNRLVNEKSPYLLQHADNPVDWYPWGDEAFHKAESEDKPVFLSIGYSTCHWCHVMAHESFEDEEVAFILNKYFVSIKVDREERPDLDSIYMQVCQMLTGSGGWPLTVFLTPDKKPFFSGTYFPKQERFGRMGMMQLLPRINDLWKNKRSEITRSTEEILNALQVNSNAQGDELNESVLHKCFNDLKERYDEEYGGFGSQPKFPSPHNFLFLLRYWKRFNNEHALGMVVNTLSQMRRGGIYDHVGFGFHRYSTDKKWLVPHFEKMLYDQALLISAYVETYLAVKSVMEDSSLNSTDETTATEQNTSSDPRASTNTPDSGLSQNLPPDLSLPGFFKRTVEEIIQYILREMTSSDGGFYSAEDADSEGEEGKFYLWELKEVRELLGNDADVFISVFNLSEQGNWEDPVHPGLTMNNIIHQPDKLNEAASKVNLSPAELITVIERSRNILFEEREKRVHPYKDDKILTDWNGLMISALAKAGAAFNNHKYIAAAEKCVSFINNKLFFNGKLLHRFRDGDAAINANADDYAFLIQGLIDLYEATFKLDYLKNALHLNKMLIRDFWDNENKGFYFTSSNNKDVIARQKDMYDGAVPSGNSVSLLNLLRLGKMTGNSDLEEMASELVRSFSGNINRSPPAYTYTLTGVDFAIGPSAEIVISEGDNKETALTFAGAIREMFYPNKVVLYKSMDNDPGELAVYTNNLLPLNKKTSLYVCRNYVCEMPVTEPTQLHALLKT